jgi:hypothetical protein
MFCNKCGREIKPGSAFCNHCGEPTGVGILPGEEETGGAPEELITPDMVRKERSFFSRPGGIALVAVVALAVIGGALAVVLLVTRGGSNEAYEKEIAGIWEEFQEVNSGLELKTAPVVALSSAGTESITAAQESIASAVERLESLHENLADLDPPDEWSNRQRALEKAVTSYRRYLQELGGFYAAFLVDPQDTNLDSMLDGMTALASGVEKDVDTFTKNNQAIADSTFETGVLDLPRDYDEELAKVRQESQDDQGQTDSERLVAAAWDAADRFLAGYVAGGWESVSGMMTESCANRFRYEIPPPDQGDFDVTGATASDPAVMDGSTVRFVVEQTEESWDGTSVFQASFLLEMVNRDGTWLVNDLDYIQ